MNLKELIESNKNQFKKSTKFEEINENEFIINFNDKLKIELYLNKETKEFLNIKILNQDERFWNINYDYDYYNELNYNSFNNWTIRTNVYTYLNFSNKIIDLIGYDNELNSNLDSYLNQQEIINLILALEDWSINCPFFKEENKKPKMNLYKIERTIHTHDDSFSAIDGFIIARNIYNASYQYIENEGKRFKLSNNKIEKIYDYNTNKNQIEAQKYFILNNNSVELTYLEDLYYTKNTISIFEVKENLSEEEIKVLENLGILGVK